MLLRGCGQWCAEETGPNTRTPSSPISYSSDRDYSERRKQLGRPRVMAEISELVVGMGGERNHQERVDRSGRMRR